MWASPKFSISLISSIINVSSTASSLEGGFIPGRMILKEHYRLGSQMVIISRTFCNTNNNLDFDTIRYIFNKGISDIRKLEEKLSKVSIEEFNKNKREVCIAVNNIINKK